MPKHGTLLCIDDDPAYLKVRKLLLETFGYKVCTSNNGRDGIRLFNSQHFDAVLVDYQMPEMNGAQVASEMRRLNPRIPILMVSAYGSLPPGVTRFVNAFISKTEPSAYLVSKIDQLLAVNSQADPVWLLAAALGTVALAGFTVQRVLLRNRHNNGEQPGAVLKTA